MRHGSSAPARALAAAGLALAIAPLAASASYAAPTQAGAIEVLGTADNKFDPVDVTAAPAADGTITVKFTSEAGGPPHTWENKQLGIDTGIVNAGASKTITFKAPPAGEHRVICSLHEQQGMVGTLTVTGRGAASPTGAPATTPAASPSSLPPASATASATVGGGEGVNAPPQDEHKEDEEHPAHDIPGVKGNRMIAEIEAERAAQQGAVSGFKFFTFVCIAFLFILGAAVLFSTRSRRPAR